MRIQLIHWKPAEAEKYLRLLDEAGHHVEYTPEFSPALFRRWKASPPDVFVIDLSRLPSHGREVATAIRQNKTIRIVPLVFCEGEPAKVEKTREFLPDAIYCTIRNLKSALGKPQRKQAAEPVVPKAMMDRYAGRSTAQKLGIAAGATLCLMDAPRDMPAALGELPENIVFVETPGSVTLCFATDADTLKQRLSELRRDAHKTKLWICWKKGKLNQGGVNETLVRETGIALGLVDYKICSVSPIWSGLLFARKSTF